MISVFICEDNQQERQLFENCIANCIMMEDYDMKLVLSTADPEVLLAYLENEPATVGLYFLDIELQHEMNGLQLAAKIREHDLSGNIIFATTHSEMLLLTFQYKVGALDFILKDTPTAFNGKIHDCLAVVNQRHVRINSHEPKFFRIQSGSQIRMINPQDIVFLETAPVSHKVILHMDNSRLEYYGTLKESLAQLSAVSKNFLQVHQSFIVNVEKICGINNLKREISFANGDHCVASFRGLKKLKSK